MNHSEFDVIKKYFTFSESRDDVLLAGGDDCAIVSVAENKQLVVTTDTLVSGVHFPETTSPEDIAYKTLMVNLSDLAAMGATPAWITLAITLTEINEQWLSSFSKQFSSLLTRFNVSLIGGDTTKGPLSITVQAMGFVDVNKSLKRSNAAVGDKIFVTGYLGDAAIGLVAMLQNINDKELISCIEKLNRPEARVDFAKELVDLCLCAIDISDGLLADLGHILEASQCGASINLVDVPVSSSAKYYFKKYHQNTLDWQMIVSKGDDYELCFTVNPINENKIYSLAKKHQIKVSCIGEINDTSRLTCRDENNEELNFLSEGFNHFNQDE
jgi:thiamine-monophosphate kinase